MTIDDDARLCEEALRALELLREFGPHRPDHVLLARARERLQVAEQFAGARRECALALDCAERALWRAARSRKPARHVGWARLQIEAVLAATLGAQQN